MHNYNNAVLSLLVVVSMPIALAQDTYLYQEQYGAGVSETADEYTKGLISNANQHPNASRSVKFKPFETVAEDSDLGSLRGLEWTWRVNVTDFAAPNAEALVTTSSGYEETTFVEPHVVNTIYDFQWPDDGNISSALKFTSDPFCITGFAIGSIPANVSNLYTEDDVDSTDCTPVLGNSCVLAITHSLSSTRGSLGCYTGSTDGFSLPECASSLGYAYEQTSKHRAMTITSNINMANSSVNRSSGDAVWGAMKDARNATNTTNYDAAVNQLQIIMINPVINGRSPAPQLLCMRVNTSHLEETTGNGSAGTGSDNNGTGEKSAARSTFGLSGSESLIIITWISLAAIYGL